MDETTLPPTFLSEDFFKSLEITLRETSADAVRAARFHRTPLITSRDGKMQRVDPFTIPIPEDKLPNSINLNGE